MSIKNQKFIQYGRSGEIVKIEVCDQTERRLDRFVCNSQKSYANALKVMKEKYGFSPEIDLEKSPNFDKETDWLNPKFDL